MTEKPLVSIGMPVYNGENYIREAINSILAQTYGNFELVISDNASTDSTEGICKSYVEKDKRVKYSRFDKNHGAARNYNQTFHLSKGKYFKWAAHDDVLDKNYIEKCVEVLENNPGISICFPAKKIIDGKGMEKEKVPYHKLGINDNSTIVRFVKFLKKFAYYTDECDAVFGLIRSDELRKTALIGNYNSSDFTLLGELVLLNKFHLIKDFLFYRRMHELVSTTTHNSREDREKWFDTSKKGRAMSAILRWFIEFSKIIYRTEKVNLLNKSICYCILLGWFTNRVAISIYNKF